MDSGPQSDIEDLRQRAFNLVVAFGNAIKEDTNLVKSIKEKLPSDDDDDPDEVLHSMMDLSSKSRESLLKKVFGSEKILIVSYFEAYNAHAEISVINISEMEKKRKEIDDIRERITELESTTTRDTLYDTPSELKRETMALGGSKKSKSKNTKKSRGKRNMVKSLKKRQKHKTKSKKKN